MSALYVVTLLAFGLSLAADRKRTFKAVKLALKKLLKITPAFFTMLILVSLLLYFVPDQLIARYLGTQNAPLALFLAAFFGSITLFPGFIAYPLCGLLLSKGVPYVVIATFSTTLMMVGVVTFPLEKEFFGTKFALLRNLVSLAIALLVALFIGLCYGEL